MSQPAAFRKFFSFALCLTLCFAALSLVMIGHAYAQSLTSVPSGSTINVTVSAQSPSGAPLSYRWLATDGVVANANTPSTSPSTTWTLPKGQGLHFLYVLISDSRGGYTEKRIAIFTTDPNATFPAVVNGDPVPSIPPVPPSPVPLATVRGWLQNQRPGISMQFVDQVTGTQFGPVTTDNQGQFAFHNLPPSTYEPYIADAPGQPFRVATELGAYSVSDNSAFSDYSDYGNYGPDRLGNAVISGHVTLADGSTCGDSSAFFGVGVNAVATLFDSTDKAVSLPVPVNAFGNYEIDASLSNTGTYSVQVQCENAPVQIAPVSVVVDPILTNPYSGVNVTIPSTPPTVTGFTATLNGTPISLSSAPTANLPSDFLPRASQFLSTKGLDSRTGACLYYVAVGAATGCDATGAPIGGITFDAWKKQSGLAPYNTTPEASASYVNAVDLNLTRNHHGIQTANGVAMYVCNYVGPADDTVQTQIDTAVANASTATNQNLVACVAMDYVTAPTNPSVNGGAPFTRFLTFGPSGHLLLSVNLDGRGEKFVPGTCVACHGGENYAGSYPTDGTGTANIGAHFLPFDEGNFVFSSLAGFRLPDQAAQIKALNQLVLQTNATPSTVNLIDAWYQSGANTEDNSYVATAWVNPTDANIPNMYSGVIKHSCRTCHVSQTGPLDLDSKGLGDQHGICGGNEWLPRNHNMPNSKVTFDRMWLSQGSTTPGTDQVAYITAWLNDINGSPTTCSYSTPDPLTVYPGTSATNLISSSNPQIFGQGVTLSATVAGPVPSIVPTGNLIIYVDGAVLGNVLLNGSATTASYTTSSLAVGSHTILASYVGDSNFLASSASLTETISPPQASAPIFSPSAGAYASAQTVAISDANAGSTIYYTTDGTTPTTSSTPYAGAINVSAAETIEAIAVATNYVQSPVTTSAYFIGAVTGPAITTVAGNGITGYSGDNGAATGAELDYPSGVAVNGAGNIYIADEVNNRIRMVAAATGIITTVAGNGVGGYSGDNGAATGAELYYPTSVAVDGAGNIYIGVHYYPSIRKVAAATGIITTVAGNGTGGYSGDNGPATSAQLAYPSGVAVDGAGNIYISDFNNNRIRKVAVATGIITTVAGNGTVGYSGDNGPATGAQLNGPTGVAVDAAGNIYFSDNQRVRMVAAATGIITTFAGNGIVGYSGDNGEATRAQLNGPSGVAVDGAGNIYISDGANQRVRMVAAATGIITTVAGNGIPGIVIAGYSGDNGPATGAQLNGPSGVAVDGAGNIYISDSGNLRIRKVILSAAPPVFSIAAGTYTTAQTVTITDATAGATIYYTTNGTAPTTSSTLYAGAITVSATETIQAIAVATNYSTSAVATAAYTITPPAATPTFSLAAGTYTAAQTVTIADTTTGAIIYYTTNGTAPTTGSTLYAGAITVSASETIEALAVAAGFSSSAVATATYTISAAKSPQTITFGAAPALTVGGAGTLSATASSGLAVTFTSTTTSICTVSGSTVTGVAAGSCVVAANQAGNTNYNAASQVTQSITVPAAKTNQTITFGAAPTVRVGASGTVSATATSGLAVVFTSTTPTVCTVSGSTVTGVAAGTCTIAGNQSGNATYNAAPQVTQTITVSAAKTNQTITFGAAPAVTVGGTGTVSATATSGLTVTFTSATTSICTVSGSTVTGVATGTCSIAANQAGNTNYNAAPQVTQSITVAAAKKNQTITFGAAPALTVGGTGTVSATATSGLAVTITSTTTSICTVSGSTVTGVATGTCTIAGNQPGNTTYNAAPQVTQNITVGKGSQTITFGTAPAVTVGGTGTVSATATSGLAVTFTSTTTSICTVIGSTVTGVATGTCSIAVNQAGNTNYNAAPQVTQSITVTAAKKNQTIAFGAAPTVKVGTTGTVSATTTSGLAVAFTSTTPTICTISGTTVTGVAAGTCTIAGNQPGNTTYNAAPQVTQNITVGKGSQTITLTVPTSITRPATGKVTATVTSALAVSLTSTTSTVCTISGTTVTGIAAGTCTIAANQAGNANYNAAAQVTRNIKVN